MATRSLTICTEVAQNPRLAGCSDDDATMIWAILLILSIIGALIAARRAIGWIFRGAIFLVLLGLGFYVIAYHGDDIASAGRDLREAVSDILD